MAEQAGLADFAIYSVEMAVDEACSNIIEHAYGGENRGEIVCTCTVDPIGITIVLQDKGKPFDPKLVKVPDLKASLEERESHGLGLHFIRQWMDRVEFEPGSSQGNRLTMVKLRGSAEAPSGR
jgi:serine/threonine-protein kinase RsbW